MPLNGTLKDFGIYLSCLDVGVSHHTGDIFYRYIIREGKRSETMPGNMGCQRLVNLAEHYNDMQVVIGLLIADVG